MTTRILYPPLTADVVFLDELDVPGKPLKIHESGVKAKCIAPHPTHPWFALATNSTTGAISVIDYKDRKRIMSKTLYQIYASGIDNDYETVPIFPETYRGSSGVPWNVTHDSDPYSPLRAFMQKHSKDSMRIESIADAHASDECAAAAAALGEVKQILFLEGAVSTLVILMEAALLLYDWRCERCQIVTGDTIASALPSSDPALIPTITACECVCSRPPVLALGLQQGHVLLFGCAPDVWGPLPGGLLHPTLEFQNGAAVEADGKSGRLRSSSTGGSEVLFIKAIDLALPANVTNFNIKNKNHEGGIFVSFFTASTDGQLHMWSGVVCTSDTKVVPTKSGWQGPSAVLREPNEKARLKNGDVIYSNQPYTLLSTGTPSSDAKAFRSKLRHTSFGHSNNHHVSSAVSYDSDTQRIFTSHSDYSVRVWDCLPLVQTLQRYLSRTQLAGTGSAQKEFSDARNYQFVNLTGSCLYAEYENAKIDLDSQTSLGYVKQHYEVGVNPNQRTLVLPQLRKFKLHDRLIREKNRTLLSLVPLHGSEVYPACSENVFTALSCAKGETLVVSQALYFPKQASGSAGVAGAGEGLSVELNDGHPNPRLRTIHEINVAALLREHLDRLDRNNSTALEQKEAVLQATQSLLAATGGGSSALKVYSITPLVSEGIIATYLLGTNVGQCAIMLHSDRLCGVAIPPSVASHELWKSHDETPIVITLPERAFNDLSIDGSSSDETSKSRSQSVLELWVTNVGLCSAASDGSIEQKVFDRFGAETLPCFADIQACIFTRKHHLGNAGTSVKPGKPTTVDIILNGINSSNGNNASSPVSSHVLALTRPALLPSPNGEFLAVVWPDMCRYAVLRVRPVDSSLALSQIAAGECSSFAWVGRGKDSTSASQMGERQQVYAIMTPAYLTSIVGGGTQRSSGMFSGMFGSGAETGQAPRSTTATIPPILTFYELRDDTVSKVSVKHSIPPGWHTLSSGPLLFVLESTTYAFKPGAVTASSTEEAALITSSSRPPGLYVPQQADYRAARRGRFYALKTIRGAEEELIEAGPYMRATGACISWCSQSGHVAVAVDGTVNILRVTPCGYFCTVGSCSLSQAGSLRINGFQGLRAPQCNTYQYLGWQLGILYIRLPDGSIRMICTLWSRGSAFCEAVESQPPETSSQRQLTAVLSRNNGDSRIEDNLGNYEKILDVIDVSVPSAHYILRNAAFVGIRDGSLILAARRHVHITYAGQVSATKQHSQKHFVEWPLHQYQPLAAVAMLLAAGASGHRYLYHMRRIYGGGINVTANESVKLQNDAVHNIKSISQLKHYLELHKRILDIVSRPFCPEALHLQALVGLMCHTRGLDHITCRLPLLLQAAQMNQASIEGELLRVSALRDLVDRGKYAQQNEGSTFSEFVKGVLDIQGSLQSELLQLAWSSDTNSSIKKS